MLSRSQQLAQSKNKLEQSRLQNVVCDINKQQFELCVQFKCKRNKTKEELRPLWETTGYACQRDISRRTEASVKRPVEEHLPYPSPKNDEEDASAEGIVTGKGKNGRDYSVIPSRQVDLIRPHTSPWHRKDKERLSFSAKLEGVDSKNSQSSQRVCTRPRTCTSPRWTKATVMQPSQCKISEVGSRISVDPQRKTLFIHLVVPTSSEDVETVEGVEGLNQSCDGLSGLHEGNSHNDPLCPVEYCRLSKRTATARGLIGRGPLPKPNWLLQKEESSSVPSRTVSTALTRTKPHDCAKAKEDAPHLCHDCARAKEDAPHLCHDCAKAKEDAPHLPTLTDAAVDANTDEGRARSAVPIGKYIRAVEAGFQTAHIIGSARDLRVPISRGRVRREGAELVQRWSPFTVSSAMEKKRMQQIQTKINSFLGSLN